MSGPPLPMVCSSGPAAPMTALPSGGQDAGMTDDTPISYQAATRGTPVLSSAGTQIGALEHVLEVPEVDVFDGIVVATKAGLRFIDAEDVVETVPRVRRAARSIASMPWRTRGTVSTTSS